MIGKIVELYRRVSTTLPDDVMAKLDDAFCNETNDSAKNVLGKMLDNARLASGGKVPICQDTGTPIFYVKRTADVSEVKIKKDINEASRIATEQSILRPNSIDSSNEQIIGNVPEIYFKEVDTEAERDATSKVDIRLMLKGGGSENITQVYSLPGNIGRFKGLQRDIDGVRKCVIDAVLKAQSKACPPYVIAAAVGGTVAGAAKKSKLMLFDDIGVGTDEKLLSEINNLGIGPVGLPGRTVALDAKIGYGVRHPASYFVVVSFSCWCTRRGRL
ncbi:fumarate hydratase [Candidatus Woesearchaeota archaeon]|nr:fumarate hydratase [Candidatus Woesearchaeota archaeon]